VLDRLALIATLFKAILHGVFAGVVSLVPRPLKPVLWVALAPRARVLRDSCNLASRASAANALPDM
jgi:hypothetical protein